MPKIDTERSERERDAERKQAKALMGVNALPQLEMEEKAKMYVDKKEKEIETDSEKQGDFLTAQKAAPLPSL